MPLYTHTAQVTCRYRFPLDMLRYDSAYPATEEDAGKIEDSLATQTSETFTVQVRKNTTEKKARWTSARWRSFGCQLEPLETLKLAGRAIRLNYFEVYSRAPETH